MSNIRRIRIEINNRVRYKFRVFCPECIDRERFRIKAIDINYLGQC